MPRTNQFQCISFKYFINKQISYTCILTKMFVHCVINSNDGKQNNDLTFNISI